MLLQDEVKLLQKLDLFSDIDPGRLKILAFASERCHFDPEELLFREGDESFGALIVMSGTVEITKAEDSARYRKTGSAGAVAIVGQSSMMTQQSRNATVTAVTEVEALRINRECFVKLMATCPKSSAGIMCALGRKLSDDDSSPAEMAMHRVS